MAFIYGGPIDLHTYAMYFAKMGYTVASISYRQYESSSNVYPLDNDLTLRLLFCERSDLLAAIRFFKKDAAGANVYNIDPDQVFVYGLSAGGTIALQAIYLNNINEVSDYLWDIVAETGGIDGNSGNQGYDSRVKGVINIAGGILDISMIDAGDPPCLSIHSKKDEMVPYNNGYFTMPEYIEPLAVYGGEAIYNKMAQEGISGELITVENANHNSTMNACLCDDKIAEFLYNLLSL